MASFAEDLRQLSIVLNQRFTSLEQAIMRIDQRLLKLEEEVQKLIGDSIAQPYAPGSGNIVVPKGFVFCVIDSVDTNGIAKASPTKDDPRNGQVDKDDDNQIIDIWAPGLVSGEFCLVFNILSDGFFKFVAIGFGNRVRIGTITQLTTTEIRVTFDDENSSEDVTLSFFGFAGADPTKSIPDLRVNDSVPCVSIKATWYLALALNGRIDC